MTNLLICVIIVWFIDEEKGCNTGRKQGNFDTTLFSVRIIQNLKLSERSIFDEKRAEISAGNGNQYIACIRRCRVQRGKPPASRRYRQNSGHSQATGRSVASPQRERPSDAESGYREQQRVLQGTDQDLESEAHRL